MGDEVKRTDAFLALFAYVPVFFLIPLLLMLLSPSTRNRFVLYHTRQGLYFFSVFLVLFILFAALFRVFSEYLRVPTVENVFAVLIAFTFLTYLGGLVFLCIGALRRRMIMLPVLGELAGER